MMLIKSALFAKITLASEPRANPLRKRPTFPPCRAEDHSVPNSDVFYEIKDARSHSPENGKLSAHWLPGHIRQSRLSRDSSQEHGKTAGRLR